MSIAESAAWKAIAAHKAALGDISLKKLFSEDAERFSRFSVQFQDILLDYSKNWVTADTMKLLSQLIDTAKVGEFAKRMFSGEAINFTENRAVLHIALRNRSNTPILVDGKDVMPEVRFPILSAVGRSPHGMQNGRSFTPRILLHFWPTFSVF